MINNNSNNNTADDSDIAVANVSHCYRNVVVIIKK